MTVLFPFERIGKVRAKVVYDILHTYFTMSNLVVYKEKVIRLFDYSIIRTAEACKNLKLVVFRGWRISQDPTISRTRHPCRVFSYYSDITATRAVVGVGEKSFSPSRPNLCPIAVSCFGSDNQGFTISIKTVIPLCRIIVRFSV